MPEPATPLDVRVTDDQPPLDVKIVAEDETGTGGTPHQERRSDERNTGRIEQTALRSSRQNAINNIWEFTQSYVAVAVVTTTAAGIFYGRVINESAIPFPAEWWTIVGLVIGFYFGRTNHARMGEEPRNARASDALDDR